MKIEVMKYCLCLCLFLGTMGLMAQGQEINHEYAFRYGDKILVSQAPRLLGVSYRIELLKVDQYSPADPALKAVQRYGNLYPERVWGGSSVF